MLSLSISTNCGEITPEPFICRTSYYFDRFRRIFTLLSVVVSTPALRFHAVVTPGLDHAASVLRLLRMHSPTILDSHRVRIFFCFLDSIRTVSECLTYARYINGVKKKIRIL